MEDVDGWAKGGSRVAPATDAEEVIAEWPDTAFEQLGGIDSAPIGLDIGALTAAETAISILGEITALRRGREGGRLIASKERIHDAAPDRARPAGSAT